MMKRCYSVFLVLILAVLVFGCTSNAPSQSPAANSDPNIPDFVLNPPVDKDTLFATGSAKLTADSLSITMAESQARQSLALQLNVIVQGMITSYQREAGIPNNTTSQEFAENVGRQLVNTELTGAVPIKREKTSDGTWWVLLSYSKAEAAKTAATVVENEASRYAEFKAMEAIKLMDAEMAKN
jgi:hypothetical protein